MFENQIVVITGGSSGIGLATAEEFAAEGAKTVFNLDIHPPQKLVERMEFIECDVRVSKEVRDKISLIQSATGSIDVLFANAGVFALGSIEETDDELLSRVMSTNILGTWWVIQACIGVMKQRKRGSIVICGSDQSLVGRRKSAAYGLTKGAIGQLTKSLALDYAEFGTSLSSMLEESDVLLEGEQSIPFVTRDFLKHSYFLEIIDQGIRGRMGDIQFLGDCLSTQYWLRIQDPE